MFYILVNFAFISTAYCGIFIEAPCPNVKPVTYFNLTALADGTWYEIGRYPNDFESRGDCGSLTFKSENNTITFEILDIANHNRHSLKGIVDYAPGAGTSGIVNFYTSGFTATEGSNVLQIFILDVVAGNYCVVFECKYDETKKRRHDYAWVMAKTTKLDNDSQKAVDALLKSTSFIDPSKFSWDHFDSEACKIRS